jgi:hypothetical protein
MVRFDVVSVQFERRAGGCDDDDICALVRSPIINRATTQPTSYSRRRGRSGPQPVNLAPYSSSATVTNVITAGRPSSIGRYARRVTAGSASAGAEQSGSHLTMSRGVRGGLRPMALAKLQVRIS